MTEKDPITRAFQLIRNLFDKVEPLSVFTVLFLLIGGIHQLYNLVQIGFPYIRFFSSTQLLSDSIALFIAISFYIVIPCFLGGLSIYFSSKMPLEDLIIAIIHGFICQLSLIIIIVTFSIIFYTNRGSSLSQISAIQTYFIVALSFFSSGAIFTSLYFDSKREEIFFKYTSKGRYILIIATLWVTPLIFIGKIDIKSFNTKLFNISKINKTYKTRGFQSEILYFNDNFIFVEIKKDSVFPNKKKPETIINIEVLKFDKFFE